MNRRDFISVGGIAGVGLTLSDYNNLLANESVAPNAKAKSVIYIYLPGGFSAQETFDPKPLAPEEYKGPVKAIDTSLDGVQFGEYYKETAKIANKLTIIRSMTHGETAHERGEHDMLTGWKPSAAITYPSLGSVVSHELGIRNNIPSYIAIPKIPNEWGEAGYLSQSYNPFSIGSNPESPDFKVRDLRLPEGVSRERFEKRKAILDIVNNKFRSANPENDKVKAVDYFYDNAFAMLDNKTATGAFDLSQENENTKEMYGKSAAGMRLLLARRLVEAGSRFITVSYGGWDMHQNIQAGMRNNVPSFDKAFATLIKDLEQRGLLESTLVMIGSEFGRTPKINSDAGRDHWPRVFSSVMAGGGVKQGFVYGKSTLTSDDVLDSPVRPESWAATVLHLLGVDYTKHLMAPGNRPVKIIDNGFKHIQGLLS